MLLGEETTIQYLQPAEFIPEVQERLAGQAESPERRKPLILHRFWDGAGSKGKSRLIPALEACSLQCICCGLTDF